MALELVLPVAPGLRLADDARCVELPRAAMAADWERERECGDNTNNCNDEDTVVTK